MFQSHLPICLDGDKDDELSELDDIRVRGFAWSGGGRGIVRVDVVALETTLPPIQKILGVGGSQCF